MIYFDTSYIVRLYLPDLGWKKVRELAAVNHLACGLHGRAETIAAFHRKFRDGYVTSLELKNLIAEFDLDCASKAIQWLPLSEAVVERVAKTYTNLPKNTPLRAADALHLSCAAENSFPEIYSNDTHLLAAASHFRLRGINVI